MIKLNQQGIGHHLVIAGLAVLVLGVAFFAGWRTYQGRQLDASASSIGYTNLYASNGPSGAFAVWACKFTPAGAPSSRVQYKFYVINSSKRSYERNDLRRMRIITESPAQTVFVEKTESRSRDITVNTLSFQARNSMALQDNNFNHGGIALKGSNEDRRVLHTCKDSVVK